MIAVTILGLQPGAQTFFLLFSVVPFAQVDAILELAVTAPYGTLGQIHHRFRKLQ